MITKKIKINSGDWSVLREAADTLNNGGIVAFPTETVYGLGANALNEEAVKNIYKAKGRPSDNPLIVHISDKKDILNVVCDVPENALILMEAFSPGPITYIMKKNKRIGDFVTAGLDTVAVRIPSNIAASELIRMSGCPVVAPSANLSGKPSPTKAEHVIKDMDGRIDYIIDGGSCRIGLESTVVDMTGDFPVILRPGAVTIEMIREYIPSAMMNTQLTGDIPKSPGMKYKHYSPDADVIVVEGSRENGVIEKICELCSKNKDKKVGVILRGNTENPIADADFILYAGNTSDVYAANLFDLLRKCDDHGADIVFAELEKTDGIGAAVRNRIYKTAGNNIIRV